MDGRNKLPQSNLLTLPGCHRVGGGHTAPNKVRGDLMHGKLSRCRAIWARGSESCIVPEVIPSVASAVHREGLAVEAKRHCSSEIQVVERRLVAIDEKLHVDADWRHLTDRLRHLALQVLQERDREAVRPDHLELVGNKCQYGCRHFFDDRELDAAALTTPRARVSPSNATNEQHHHGPGDHNQRRGGSAAQKAGGPIVRAL